MKLLKLRSLDFYYELPFEEKPDAIILRVADMYGRSEIHGVFDNLYFAINYFDK